MTTKVENEFYKRAVLGKLERNNTLLADMLDEFQTMVVLLRTIMAEQAEVKADLRARSLLLPNILTPAGG